MVGGTAIILTFIACVWFLVSFVYKKQSGQRHMHLQENDETSMPPRTIGSAANAQQPEAFEIGSDMVQGSEDERDSSKQVEEGFEFLNNSGLLLHANGSCVPHGTGPDEELTTLIPEAHL